MSDLVNALNQQSHSSSVLDAISHPSVVNPLAAMAGAAQTANTIYGLREKQAQQAAGEAYQGAIDPQTGEFDANKFRQNLQAAGPTAAMAAGTSLANTQQISSDQLNQARAKTAWVNSATGSLTRLGPNITQADVIGVLHQGVTSGVLTEAEFQRQVAEVGALGNDPAKLYAWANQHQFNAMSVQQQLDQTYGTRETVVTPGATYSTVVPPARQGGTVTTQHGPAPGQTVEATVPMDDQGVIPQDANGNPVRTPKTWQKVTVPVTAVPGVPKGGPPQVSTAPPPPPKGTNVIPNGGYVAPGSPSPAPAPAPAPATPAPSGGSSVGGKGGGGGPRSDIPSGVQVASADGSFAPSSGPATAPSDAVAGDVAAIQGGMANANAAPSNGPQMAQNGPILRSAPPPGYTETLNNDLKARTEASLAASDQRKNLQAGENALEALKLAGNYTGTGTGTAATLYSWLQARAPQWAIPQGTMTDTAWRQVLAKNLLRFAQESGLRMNTDLGMSEALKGTANADTILPNANREILINDIGMARQRVAQTQLMPDASGSGDVVKHFQTYTSDTDPRAFAWDLYSPEERKAIEADVAKDKSGKAEKRLDKGLEDASKLGLIRVPGATQRQGSVQPSGPVATPPVTGATANPLAMNVSPYSSPVANALAA